MERKYTKFNNPIFIDSGAHGLYNEHVIKKKHKLGYSWFETDEFTKYMDRYATFIKTHKIKYYANVDVIFNPELSWKAQKYLEDKHGLSPIPVIHFGTPIKWLEKYLTIGYDFIGLGGLGQEARTNDYIRWADNMFALICNEAGDPCIKVHGFAMTSHLLMSRYPWWSVDSTSFIKQAVYGFIKVPPFVQGEWRYDIPDNLIRVSDRHSKTTRQPSSTGLIKKYTLRYIEEKGFKVGAVKKENNEVIILEKGVTNSGEERAVLNALYYLDLGKYLTTHPPKFRKLKKFVL